MERRRLLSSRAGKLPSSRLTISPWLRAVALEPFPVGRACSATPRVSLGGPCCTGWPGNGQGRVVPAPELERPKPGDACEVPVPCPALPTVPRLPALAYALPCPIAPGFLAWQLCLLNEEVWIFPTI